MKSKILKLGIIGGGQLGMFLAKAAKDNNIEPYVYSNTKNAPAEKYTKKMKENISRILKINKNQI